MKENREAKREVAESAMKILISGAGIAGPTLAYWLAHYGHEPVLIEKAPRLRSGGYIIDFWGAGFEIADKMGLMPEIRSSGYLVEEVRVVNRSGRRVAGFPASAFARATHGRYISLPRGDLAATIFRAIEDRVETIFNDSVARIEQSDASVRVGLANRTCVIASFPRCRVVADAVTWILGRVPRAV